MTQRYNAYPNRTMSLREGNLDGLAGGAHGATATDTLHDNVEALATAVAGVALGELVCAGLTAGGGPLAAGIRLALESADFHVRSALGALGGDLSTVVLVDVTGDIEGTVLAEGNLPPCGVKTTEVGKLGVLEGRGAGRGNVLGERDDSLLSRLEADRDLGLVDVQGHAGEAVGLPAEDDGVLVGVVGELGLPLAVVADPDATVVALVVLADGLDTEGVADVLDTVEKVGDELADVVDEVANEVARLGLGRSSSGAGRSSRGRSGSRGLDLLGLERSSGAGRGGLRGLLLGNRSRGGGLRGGSRSGRSEDRAPVDLLPVDVLQVVGNATPVDVLGSRALSLTGNCQC
jgi:hypothetical protein